MTEEPGWPRMDSDVPGDKEAPDTNRTPSWRQIRSPFSPQSENSPATSIPPGVSSAHPNPQGAQQHGVRPGGTNPQSSVPGTPTPQGPPRVIGGRAFPARVNPEYPSYDPRPEPASSEGGPFPSRRDMPREAFQPTPPIAKTQRSKRSGPGWGALVGAMVATALVAVGATIAVIDLESTGGTSTSQPSALTSQSGGTVAPVPTTGEAPDWEAVAAAVRPATVSIAAQGQTTAATGSGVIIDTDGSIVTNNHVVADVVGGGELDVTLSDGRLYTAELVGTDPTTDLAVIRLVSAPDDLVAATLVDEENLSVGQPVMAIGSPLGLSDTVTTGVISALDRPVVVQSATGADGQGGVDPFGLQNSNSQVEAVYTNAIQIDASINPGNSGGPLFDANGRVIGINSSIASMSSSSETAGSIGLGFAIPAVIVRNVSQQILTTGTVKHALLGVQIRSAEAEIGGAKRVGAGIASVNPGGAAEAAGLREGDVIVGVDGHAVVSGSSLTGYIRRYQAGDEVTLDVVRDGQDQQVEVTLQEK